MSSSTEGPPEAREFPPPRTGLLAALLVLAVAVVLIGLNVLDPPSAHLSVDRLEPLLQQGLVAVVQVQGDHLECILTGPVRLAEERELVERVVVRWGGPPCPEEILHWESAGAQVVRVPGAPMREWPWAILLGALLTGGVWHLVCQARRHRRLGSPRQRLEELDRQFAAGDLTREERDQLVSELTLEL